MNRLLQEKSPYLRHAAEQEIDWYPWCDEAFETALAKDRAVFLSSGAIWCHWCHVMAKECFADPEIAELMNDLFICIKLDRDERPDIDKRYQQAVTAMGSGGGWPLSIFLTADRKPFFGGTYFPPEDMHGRPGFKRVLEEVARFYRERRDEVDGYAGQLIEYLKPAPLSAGPIGISLLHDGADSMLSDFDHVNGGFGTAPKFPMPGALEFLMNRFALEKDDKAGLMITKTLDAMMRGGMHDHLAGGFHRYSTDAAWTIPHFEKMADDNAALLRLYADAYRLFGRESYLETAKGIVRFLREVLSDPGGGFYASQDADVTPEDEGGYFTWREEDLRDALNDDEFAVFSRSFVHERGRMHHDPSKAVLFLEDDGGVSPQEGGKAGQGMRGLITSARTKLLAVRNSRQAPFIDTTLYTSLNGMLIAALLRASRVIHDDWPREFSLKSLDRIMRDHFDRGDLYHTEAIAGMLADYVFLADAHLEAYDITGRQDHVQHATALMSDCIDRFGHPSEGGFFDTKDDLLGIRLKGIEDVPHVSPNALSFIVLLKLWHITGDRRFGAAAEAGLTAFASVAADLGTHGGYYFCSLDHYYHMIRITLETSPVSEIADAVRRRYIPCSVIIYGDDKGRVLLCRGDVCYEPLSSVKDVEKILTLLKLP